jgi:hypothetical protein
MVRRRDIQFDRAGFVSDEILNYTAWSNPGGFLLSMGYPQSVKIRANPWPVNPRLYSCLFVSIRGQNHPPSPIPHHFRENPCHSVARHSRSPSTFRAIPCNSVARSSSCPSSPSLEFFVLNPRRILFPILSVSIRGSSLFVHFLPVLGALRVKSPAASSSPHSPSVKFRGPSRFYFLKVNSLFPANPSIV